MDTKFLHDLQKHSRRMSALLIFALIVCLSMLYIIYWLYSEVVQERKFRRNEVQVEAERLWSHHTGDSITVVIDGGITGVDSITFFHQNGFKEIIHITD